MATPLIQIEQLSWRYTVGDWVLKEINLCVESGERILVAGKSGSGKSTLALALNGTIPHSQGGGMMGRVIVCGTDTITTSVPALAQKVAMVFQSPDDQMSQIVAFHEVASGPANSQLSKEEVNRRTNEALVLVGIEHLASRETNTLSGGEKQKLALASALAMKPSLLVLDEPTTDLDPASKREIIELLRRLEETETAILVVSHDVDTISSLVDRLVIVKEGQIIYDGDKHLAFQKPDILSASGVAIPQVVAFSHLMRNLDPQWPIATTIEEASRGLHANGQGPLPSSHPACGKEVVRIEGASFCYPRSRAPVIDNLSLSVHQGEMIALIGNNGAGKSTLCKLILGLLKPTKGKVLVLGEEVKSIRPEYVGYVPQNPDSALFCSSVREEVGFALKSMGDPNWQQATEQMLESLGLTDLCDRFPLALSQGQRQKVAYAAVSISQPPVLIFDEPTTGVDFQTCEQIMKFMDLLRRQGKTIIFVTHDMPLAFAWADRIVIMREGRITYDDLPELVIANGRKEIEESRLALPPISVLAQRIGYRYGVRTPEELVEVVRGGIEHA